MQILERRDKAGFPMPVDAGFANELVAPIGCIVSSRASIDRGVFREAALRSPTPGVTLGWGPLNLELWWRIFVDEALEPSTPLPQIE